MYFAAAISLFRFRKTWVIEEYPAGRSLAGAKRVAIFVHFDRQGRIHDFVRHYLSSLRELGFEIVFVSNSPKLRERDVSQIKAQCAKILLRKNVGYDFGAYKDALLELGDLSTRNEVLLVNDSVYGPLSNLGTLLSRCDSQAGVWGMTDSWEFKYHLQSYFLLMKKEALSNPSLVQFWRNVRYVSSKYWIIRKYEIGLTQTMLRNRVNCAALFPYKQATAALADAVILGGVLDRKNLPEHQREYIAKIFKLIERGVPLNATHFFWDYLIGKGCPFVKRDLLLLNPAKIPFVHQWLTLIQRCTTYDTDLILRHLQSISRNRAI